MKVLFDQVAEQCSQLVTRTYSTSFSFGVQLLHPSIRQHIYNIYGFVRLADEIVDSFHAYDKAKLLEELETDYQQAFQNQISLNPILNAFQHTVHRFSIGQEVIQAFLESMKTDLHQTRYTQPEYTRYIYGSADAVGLMCLTVFVQGNSSLYNELKPYAMRLGSAFQKVNFLRDLKNDTQELNRNYFPILQSETLNETNKKKIIAEIHEDFQIARIGIRQLPREAQLGVYIAFIYYLQLLRRLERVPAQSILTQRIRISNTRKIALALLSGLRHWLRLI